MFLDLVLSLLDQPAHRLADLAARPHVHGLHGLLNALDLDLGLLDMQLNPFPQGIRAGLAQRPLHAAQRLLFGAVGVLELLGEEFAHFRLHEWSPAFVFRCQAVWLPWPSSAPVVGLL